LIADASISDFTQRSTSSHVRVVSPQATELAPLLQHAGASVVHDVGALLVTGMEAPQIGYLAAEHRIEIHELSMRRASLEAAFMELTEDSVEYHPLESQATEVAKTAEALSGKATR
jgi:ABC-2 type transport system ATP-binding protein